MKPDGWVKGWGVALFYICVIIIKSHEDQIQ